MPRAPRKARDPVSVRAMRDRFAADIAGGTLEIGAAVKRMREISGLTQEQFAKHRGVSPDGGTGAARRRSRRAAMLALAPSAAHGRTRP